jgi:uncharacterized protein YbjT (DUF2867 family)
MDWKTITMTKQKRPKWDAGRFWKTLSYFGVVPFLGNISWIRNLITGGKSTISKPEKPGVILVAGATGGVGKRVVQKLQQRGYAVRGLVRDLKRGREMLGTGVDLVDADITLADSLSDRLLQDVTAVISCIGTRVQPVEGDTPTREKYYQGIKFYTPEVLDVPEQVEYRGIQNLVDATRRQFATLGAPHEKIIFDFSKPTDNLKEIWGALDDVVMGGVSESNVRLVNGTALFSGNVSTSNSGGFVSIRTRNFEPPLDLSAYQGIDIRVKGDGNRYKFILRTDPKWDSISYCYSFDTVANIEFTVRIPFSEFIPVFRAKTLKDCPPLDASQIRSVQIMLSKFEYDGDLNPKFTPGLFQLQIQSLKAYGGPSLPRFIQVSSAGVTRPGRPGLDLESEPPAVRMNEQLGGILTWKLRGEDAIRASGLPYTIIRPCALTEEPGGDGLMFEQGDNIKGQVSREDIAELCVQALELPEACNMTFEVKADSAGSPTGEWRGLFARLERDRQAVS